MPNSEDLIQSWGSHKKVLRKSSENNLKVLRKFLESPQKFPRKFSESPPEITRKSLESLYKSNRKHLESPKKVLRWSTVYCLLSSFYCILYLYCEKRRDIQLNIAWARGKSRVKSVRNFLRAEALFHSIS